MKEAFLAAVQQGDVEAVKNLIKANTDQFHVYYYYNKFIENTNNVRGSGQELGPFNASQIAGIKLKALDHWDNMAYKTYGYLGFKLSQETMNSALIVAAQQNNAPMLTLLLLGGFKRNIVKLIKSDVKTIAKDEHFTSRFLDHPGYAFKYTPANPNAQNKQGKSALELAIEANSPKSVKCLLQFGAQVSSDETFDYCEPLIPDLLKNCTAVQKERLSVQWDVVFPDLFKAFSNFSWPMKLPTWLFQSMMSLTVPITQFLGGSSQEAPQRNERRTLNHALEAPSPTVSYEEGKTIYPSLSKDNEQPDWQNTQNTMTGRHSFKRI